MRGRTLASPLLAQNIGRRVQLLFIRVSDDLDLSMTVFEGNNLPCTERLHL